MKIDKFEDIVGWQKSKILTLDIYAIFKDCLDFSYKRQIFRAVVSIMNNIAEGFERKTNNEFKHFLYISKGSCGEVRSMLYLAYELKYISKDDFDRCYAQAVEISKILSGLIKSL